MAGPYYVRSSSSNTAPYDTWAKAATSLATALAAAAHGDTIWVSQAHAFGAGNNGITITSPGTLADPCFILCGNDGATPPTALAATGSETNTGSVYIDFNGSFYMYGMIFSDGSSTNNVGFRFAQNAAVCVQEFEQCTFRSATTDISRIAFGGAGGYNNLTFKLCNCKMKFAAAISGIDFNQGTFEWCDGSIESGSTALTTALIDRCGYYFPSSSVRISNIDFTNLGVNANFVNAANCYNALVVISRCKLPASWGGALTTASFNGPGARIEMWDCDNANTNYKLWIAEYGGSIRDDISNTLVGGFSDGTTLQSWKMVTSANAKFPTIALTSPPMFGKWNDTTGSTVTFTVEFAQASGATKLTNADIALDVDYPGVSGYPQGVRATTEILPANYYPSGASGVVNYADSTATWNTLSSPVKQKIVLALNGSAWPYPTQKGGPVGRIRLMKASATVYVNPEMTVS